MRTVSTDGWAIEDGVYVDDDYGYGVESPLGNNVPRTRRNARRGDLSYWTFRDACVTPAPASPNHSFGIGDIRAGGTRLGPRGV